MGRALKILLVALNHHPELTGIGKYQGEMASWFASRGHRVRVVCAPPYYPAWRIDPKYSGWRYRREVIDGVTVYRVPIYVPATPSSAKRLLHLLSFAASSLPAILWQALAWRPDIVMVTEPPLFASANALLASWVSAGRSHLHVQDFEVDAAVGLGLLGRSGLVRLARGLESRLMRLFSGVSSISPRMCERLVAKGVDPRRVMLIPNWSNVGEFDPAIGPGTWRERLKADRDTVIALYSGNIGRKQGIETIVESARLLSGRRDILFVISGGGAALSEISQSAQGLANVILLPVQQEDEFRHLMVVADIHLLPQRAEAADLVMPSKLGNILASGRPVVAGASSGTQVYEAIKGCGIAVPPDDAAGFADAIAMLAADPARRQTLGAAARARALSEWSRDPILEKLETLFGLQGKTELLRAWKSGGA